MPAEWTPHRATWMAWPTEHAQWDNLAQVQQGYADVANAIGQFEPVMMVADPIAADAARRLCSETVSVIEMPTDDSWMRDNGPSFLRHPKSGEVAGCAWRFNAWGGYFSSYQRDARIATMVLDRLGMAAYRSSLTMEGGALHVDGEGTLITTESVVLNSNRNPGLEKPEATDELCAATGSSQVIWLPGDPDGITGDMTDGHIDGDLCFVRPGVVLFERDISAQGDLAKLEAENRRALSLAKDARGRSLEIIDLEVDHAGIGEDYELFCSRYMNFYLVNEGLVMPCYGVPADNNVREMLEKLFSERRVVMVNINAIAPGGGGIHCITQQQPA